MKINEIEAAVGISKKNIRFYEEAGLLHPRRNTENGYRDYCEADIARLQQIKLLRKLDVPLAEIKAMLEGKLPLSEGMRRHKIELTHRANSMAEALQFCEALTAQNGRLTALDAEAFLARLTTKEEEGVRFVNLEQQDTKKKRTRGALIGAGVSIALFLFWVGFVFAIVIMEEGALSSASLLTFGWLGVLCLVSGVVLFVVLRQRLKQIQTGEEDDYTHY
ncbi:MAG: MerR family transcriptional regulator [Faecalibacterium sp.]